MNRVIIAMFCLCFWQNAIGQNNINSFFNSRQTIDEFNILTINNIKFSEDDSIPIKVFNKLFHPDLKVYYYRKGQKRINYSLGKISETPLETIDLSNNNSKKIFIYNKIYPLFKIEKNIYTNYFFLLYNVNNVKIIILSLGKNETIISGLVAFEGIYNNEKKELVDEKVKSRFEQELLIVEKKSDLPDSDFFIKKFTQRVDGYFEEL